MSSLDDYWNLEKRSGMYALMEIRLFYCVELVLQRPTEDVTWCLVYAHSDGAGRIGREHVVLSLLGTSHDDHAWQQLMKIRLQRSFILTYIIHSSS